MPIITIDLKKIKLQNNMYNINSLKMYIWEYLILLHFSLLYFKDFAFVTNWTSVATLHWASLSATFYQQYLLTLYLGHILEILKIVQTFYYYHICYWWLSWSVISGLRCYFCNCFGASRTVPIIRWWI